MITHDQYLEYKRLVDEYEEAIAAEDDEDERDYEPDDGFDEYDERHGCTCGAWGYGSKGFIHVADCICGAG